MSDLNVYNTILHYISGQPDRNGEVHVNCPMCGKEAKRGQTHFSFHYDHTGDVAGGYCFVCGGKMSIRQIAEYYGLNGDQGDRLDNDELRLLRIEAEQRRQAAKQAELEQRLSALEQMHRCQDHLRYHNQLDEAGREYWHSQGIYDRAIDNFVLGYCDQCPTYRESASYTIPVFGYDGELINIRHRLVEENGGKYRPHLAGLGQQLFGADVLKGKPERALVLEGEKKVICYRQNGFSAVGIMGKCARWQRAWFEWFKGVPEIVIALDPDAEGRAWRLGEAFAKAGFGGVKIANFPTKPDDAIVLHGARLEDIEAILHTARPVWTKN